MWASMSMGGLRLRATATFGVGASAEPAASPRGWCSFLAGSTCFACANLVMVHLRGIVLLNVGLCNLSVDPSFVCPGRNKQ